MIALLLCKYPAMMPNEVKLQIDIAVQITPVLTKASSDWGTVDLQRLLSVYQM